VRAALASVLLCGCGFAREGLGETSDLIDSTAVVDSASADTYVAADTALPDTIVADTEQPDANVDPIFVECESGATFGDMTLASDPMASMGSWASVPTTAMPWSVGTGTPPTRVELPVTLGTGGEWYVWVRQYATAGDADAMYVGFAGGPLRRFFSLDWNTFKWVGTEGSGAALSFTQAAGPVILMVGAGEPGTGCDRVALTRDSTWTPP